jgi:peroxiredoxin
LTSSGKRFDPFVAFLVYATGNTSTIGFGEGEPTTVLFVFSATCPACEEAIPRWKAALESSPSRSVRVIGLERDRLGPARSAAPRVVPPLPCPVYGQEGAGSELSRRIPFIPATVIVDGTGRVTHAWFGVPDEEQQSELARLLTGPAP